MLDVLQLPEMRNAHMPLKRIRLIDLRLIVRYTNVTDA